METRHISIVGGNLTSALLALKIKESLPDLPVKIYLDRPAREDQSWSFRETDLTAKDWKWLTKIAGVSWKTHKVEFTKFGATINSGVSVLQLSDLLANLDAEVLTDSSLENVLHKSIFVIDTRNNSYVSTLGFYKTTEFMLELESDHQILHPMMMDGRVEQKDGIRYFQYFPMGEKSLLLKEIRLSAKPKLIGEDFESTIMNFARAKGWKVSDQSKKNIHIQRIPQVTPELNHLGRIIRLSGYINEVSGESLPDIMRVINLMVKTSFRYGEIREVLKTYSENKEKSRRILRVVSGWILNDKRSQTSIAFFEQLHKMPSATREKFFSGEINLGDFWKLTARWFLKVDPSFRRPKIIPPLESYEPHPPSESQLSLRL